MSEQAVSYDAGAAAAAQEAQDRLRAFSHAVDALCHQYHCRIYVEPGISPDGRIVASVHYMALEHQGDAHDHQSSE